MLRLIWLLWRLWLLDANDEGEGEQEGEEEELTEGENGELLDRDGQPIRDPKAKLKALESMLGRLHKRVRERDAVIEELRDENGNGDHSAELRGARLENAFLRAAMTREEAIGDLETAWDLGQLRGFFDAVKDDGQGMSEALDKLVARYPYLVDEPLDLEEEREQKPAQRKVRSKAPPQAHTKARLSAKYPALRGRG